MTERKRLPDHVEWTRMDIIAVAHDIQVLTVELYGALEVDDIPEAARINKTIAGKGKRIQELAQEQKRI